MKATVYVTIKQNVLMFKEQRCKERFIPWVLTKLGKCVLGNTWSLN